jgi:hypothetical protein
MRQVIQFDQVTRKQKKLTLLRVIETNSKGVPTEREMQLRHALQAMKVQPKRFSLAKGESLPKGVSLDMVPAGTTIKDVEEFEKKRGTIGKATRTQFDNILDAIENGLELQDVEVIDADPEAIPGAMMSEEAPEGFVPKGVDLIPADSMKEIGGTEDNEKVFDEEAEHTEPALKEIKEKELNFDQAVETKTNYTKKGLEHLPVENLQAILLNLPAVKSKTEKYQKELVHNASKDTLIKSIVQLSKQKK